VAAAGAVLALAGVVAFASRAEVGTGNGHGVQAGLPPAVLDWLVALGACVGLAALSLYLLGLRSPRARKEEDEDAPPAVIHPAVKVAVQLLALVLILAAMFFAWGVLERGGGPAPGRERQNPALPQSEARARAPEVDPQKVAVIAGVMLLVAGGLILWLRPGRRAAESRSARRAVADAVEESLGDLASEPDARRAVIAAYARMERALGESGIPRRPPEAPLEYMHRALRRLRAGEQHVRRLTGLFAVAKFSDHPVDAGMKGDAIAALEQVGRDLAEGEE
jgi:hypothetical protein